MANGDPPFERSNEEHERGMQERQHEHECRKLALEFAMQELSKYDIETIIERAGKYYDFLRGSIDPNQQS